MPDKQQATRIAAALAAERHCRTDGSNHCDDLQRRQYMYMEVSLC